MSRAAYAVGFLFATVLGGAVVSVGSWIVHANAPTSDSRAVAASPNEYYAESSRSGGGFDVAGIRIVDEAGRGFDLTPYVTYRDDAPVDAGDPVVVTRSDADGQFLAVRSPTVVVDLQNGTDAQLARIGWVIGAAVALWAAIVLSQDGRPVSRVLAILAGAAVGGLVISVFIVPRPLELDDARYQLPNAMDGYGRSGDEIIAGDEEVRYATRSVREVVPPGTPVSAPTAFPGIRLPPTSSLGVVDLTVTGPAVAGLPAGADPAVEADYATVSVPITVTTSGRFPRPVLDLIGDGQGLAIPLLTCGDAPARERYACFAVPDGFVPRYLLVGGYSSPSGIVQPDERPVAVDVR